MKRALLTSCFASWIFCAPAAFATPPVGENALTPLLKTYVELLICASAASEFRSNVEASRQYRDAAFDLEDKIIEAGWSDHTINASIVKNQKAYALPSSKRFESRESYYNKHFSKNTCTHRASLAIQYGEEGVPHP